MTPRSPDHRGEVPEEDRESGDDELELPELGPNENTS